MMQAAHLDPTDMIAFYGTLQKSEQGHAGPPDFLSTHPDMGRKVCDPSRACRPADDERAPAASRRRLDGHSHALSVQAAKRSSPDSATFLTQTFDFIIDRLPLL